VNSEIVLGCRRRPQPRKICRPEAGSGTPAPSSAPQARPTSLPVSLAFFRRQGPHACRGFQARKMLTVSSDTSGSRQKADWNVDDTDAGQSDKQANLLSHAAGGGCMVTQRAAAPQAQTGRQILPFSRPDTGACNDESMTEMGIRSRHIDPSGADYVGCWLEEMSATCNAERRMKGRGKRWGSFKLKLKFLIKQER
jgi:hypothetical protein